MSLTLRLGKIAILGQSPRRYPVTGIFEKRHLFFLYLIFENPVPILETTNNVIFAFIDRV